MIEWPIVWVCILVVVWLVLVWALSRVSARSGRSPVLGLLALVPPLGLALVWLLAFATWRKPLPAGPRRELAILSIPAILIVAIWFLGLRHLWFYDPGRPTLLRAGQAPVGAVCEIRSEFEDLGKPVMRKMNSYGPWTDRVFAVGTFRRQGFSQPALTREAREFVARHSHLEIVAAVAPLLLDPELSGEAAMLIAGLPIDNKSSGSKRIGWLTRALESARYQSPERRGSWSMESARKAQHGLYHLYGTRFSVGYSWRTRDLARDDTLEAEIARALELYVLRANEPDSVLEEDDRLQDRDTPLEAWLEQPPPRVIPEFQSELDQFSKEFLALVAFPLAGGASGDRVYTPRFLWMMNLQDEHWPLLGGRLSGPIRDERHARLLQAAADRALGVCEPARPVSSPVVSPRP